MTVRRPVRPICLLVCRQCGDGHLVRQFASPTERGEWSAEHARDTGYDTWLIADNVEEMARIVTILTLGR